MIFLNRYHKLKHIGIDFGCLKNDRLTKDFEIRRFLGSFLFYFEIFMDYYMGKKFPPFSRDAKREMLNI